MSSINPVSPVMGQQRLYTAAANPVSPGQTGSGAATKGTGATTGQTTGTSPTKEGVGMLDRDAFLKLLVAQLRYQDPSKPLDATEMVSQSAQLTVVDKLGEISTLLTESSAIDRITLAGSIIGKQISFTMPDGSTRTAIATAVSVAGASTLVRAGTFDVGLDDITNIETPPASNATPPSGGTAP